MPPLAPSHGDKSSSSGGGRHQRPGMAAGLSPAQQRSASFHGRGTEQQHRHHQKPRPKTLPDLLAGVRAASFRSGSGYGSPPSPDSDDTGRRTPSKVLVSVAVQQSMWPLHVMASAGWTVADLVAAAVALYAKEGRRPPLPSADPAAFGLHYSQFSLESLNPNEKIMELGSRSFFLCPRSPSAAGQDSSSSSGTANGVIRAASGKTPAWLNYMPFWPTM